MNMQDVISSFSTVDENGNVTERAKIRKENKEAIKEQKKAAEEANKDIGEAYYKSLSIGDVFTYKTADGTELKARKIETKSKSGLTAGCELVEVPAGSKSAKHYPKFHRLVVPQAFIDSMNAKTAEEVVA